MVLCIAVAAVVNTLDVLMAVIRIPSELCSTALSIKSVKDWTDEYLQPPLMIV